MKAKELATLIAERDAARAHAANLAAALRNLTDEAEAKLGKITAVIVADKTLAAYTMAQYPRVSQTNENALEG